MPECPVCGRILPEGIEICPGCVPIRIEEEDNEIIIAKTKDGFKFLL